MRTLIIDDERLARKELANLLKDYPQIDIIGECSNVDEARDEIEKHKPDLIFLDIQMPGKNGFDLLDELHFLPQVVFVTAYDEYAIKAFEVNALDYLLRPSVKWRPGFLRSRPTSLLKANTRIPENWAKTTRSF